MYTFKSRARPRTSQSHTSSTHTLFISSELANLTRGNWVSEGLDKVCCGRERGMETAVGKAEKCHFCFIKLQWHFLLMETLGFWSAWRTLPQPFTITLSEVIYIQSSQTETAYLVNQKRKTPCIPDLESWCFFKLSLLSTHLLAGKFIYSAFSFLPKDRHKAI